MLTLGLISGFWVAMMLVLLPRVLAHPRAIQALPLRRDYPQRRKVRHS